MPGLFHNTNHPLSFTLITEELCVVTEQSSKSNGVHVIASPEQEVFALVLAVAG
jgi:hypothetical protein